MDTESQQKKPPKELDNFNDVMKHVFEMKFAGMFDDQSDSESIGSTTSRDFS